MVRGFRRWLTAVALLAIACGKSETPPAPSSSGGPTSASRPAPISAEAARQIQALLAEKAARSPAQQKIESRLLFHVKMGRGEPIAPGIERLESSVKVDSDGFVRVDIRANGTLRVAGAVEAAGGQVTGRFERWNSVTARVPIGRIERIAEERAVLFIEELLDPQNNVDPEAPLPPATPADEGVTDAINTSSGDVTHQANVARANYGARGQGVKIGVLSDSVDYLSVSQATGDLGPVTVLPGTSGIPDTGEGTAMLEIIHDLAPDAELYFATAVGGTAVFANNILALRAAGCDVIADDVSYFSESPFQDATVAQAVNSVIASGGIYVSSAGNAGSIAKGRAGVYEGNFVDSTVTITGIPGTLTRFDNGSANSFENQLTVANSGGPMTLYWSDPLGGSSNDYDLFVLNAAMSLVVDASTNIQNGSQNPFEQSLTSPAAGNRLVVLKKPAAAARYLHLNANRGVIAIPTIGQTKGHASAAGAFAVAATPAGPAIGGPPNPVGPYPGAFTASNLLELYSSDGPRKIFYNANGTLANPGNSSLLADGGIVRQKPDITGADGVPTAVLPTFAMFYGTSAAAPHIAALAALLKSAVPGASASAIRTALTSSALDIETAGVDINSGAGIAMAPAALAALGATAVPALSLGARTMSAPGGNMNGIWEPGESATLLVNLANVGAAVATAVSATLSTTAPNVAVTQPSSSYPNIGVGNSASNVTPFGLSLALGGACSSVPVRLTVSYSGRQSAFDFVVDVGSAGSPSVFASTGGAVAIPDGSGTNTPGAPANVPIVVSGLTGGISDLDFRINGTMSSTSANSMTVGLNHGSVGQLVLTLTSPSGTTRTLINRMDGGTATGNNFFNTVLDDSGVTSIQAPGLTNPFTGTFRPDQALSGFNSENANGTWTLSVRDYVQSDTGSVRAVSLVVTPRVCATLGGLGTPCVSDGACGSGHCTDGVCCNDACGDDAPNDCQACSAAGICGAAAAATVCRATSGACDVQETCGGATTCPADAARPVGTSCGGAPSGVCDAQDTCIGTVGATATCAAAFQPASSVCRVSAGGCDVAETCTGSSTACPADVLAVNGGVCRPAANGCDVAETCNGVSPTCGADAAVMPGTACGGAPSGVCDAQDVCSGTVGASATCEARYQSSLTTCRVSAGTCDRAESCTGSSATCPADAVEPNGTVCRVSVGACDAAEACNGSSPTCGADAAVTPGTPCGGAPSGVCDAQDTCSGTLGATATCAANFQPASNVCRSSAGGCDVAESCTGSSTTCPADAIQPNGAVCRPSVGACDVAEACDGASTACGADAAVVPGTACGGAPSGVCDAQDVCSGTVGASATCEARYQSSLTTCRVSAGTCDRAESCTGSSATCPADAVEPNGTVCRVSVGACDVSEACNGSSPTCGADAAVTPGTPCGGAPSGVCDAQDTCSGTVGATATCAANFQPPSSVCRSSAGGCDRIENCTGSSTTCPADAVEPNDTVCRPSAGACDVAEACNGTSATCAADAAVTPGTSCGGPPSGVCDAQDVCAGTVGASATCAARYQPSSTTCRVSAGTCDRAESCTGSSTTCPGDLVQPNGTPCRASVGACDVADACDGTSATCGADAAATPGTACGGPPSGDCDAQDTCSGSVGATATCQARYQATGTLCRPGAGVCDIAETCTGSAPACPTDVFAGTSVECQPAAGVCDVAENCAGGSATCPVDGFASGGTTCADGNACTQGDQCNGSGACQPGGSIDCDDGNVCTAERCDMATGCVVEPVTDGTACDDGSGCTQNDACAAGQCRGTLGIDCNDGNACTTDTCDPLAACTHTPVSTGTACDDGNRCTAMDTCASGACVPGTALDCDDANECSSDSCDTASGCMHRAVSDGTSCAGGDGTCRAGACDTGEGGAGGEAGTSTGGAAGTAGGSGRGGVSGTGGTPGRGGVPGTGGVSGAGTSSSGEAGQAGEGGTRSGGTGGLGEGGMDGAGEAGVAGSRPRRGGHTTETSGCGCRVPGERDSRHLPALWLVVPLLVALRRRRRHRGPKMLRVAQMSRW